jgi:hypothetical protein
MNNPECRRKNSFDEGEIRLDVLQATNRFFHRLLPIVGENKYQRPK